MPFGGFCPLPLRLGGSTLDGWSPQQHARACADVAAMVRGKAFAVLTYDWDGAGLPYVVAYHAQHGTGPYAAPLLTKNVDGDVTITWNPAYTNDYGQTQPTSIHQARVSIALATEITWSCHTVFAPLQVRVFTYKWVGISNVRTTVVVK